MQHHYKSPKEQELVFHTLYMHLLPKAFYGDGDDKPNFMSKIQYQVNEKTSAKVKGLALYLDEKKEKSCIIPKGTQVETYGEAKELPSVFKDKAEQYKKVYRVGGKDMEGYMATAGTYATKVCDGVYTVKHDYPGNRNGALLYEEEKIESAVLDILDILPEGTIVEGEKNATFVKVTLPYKKCTYTADGTGTSENDITGYVAVKQLKLIKAWDVETDKVVLCKKPIKAGDLIGYTGLCGNATQPQYAVCHIELFTDDREQLEDFLSNNNEDNITNNVISQPFIKLPPTLSKGFKYCLFRDTPIEIKEIRGDHYKIKLGRIRRMVDRNRELKGYSYNGSSNSYEVSESSQTFLGGLLCKGELIKLEEDPVKVKNKENEPQPRNISYAYPISNQEFWIHANQLMPFFNIPFLQGIRRSNLNIPVPLGYKEFELFHEYPSDNDRERKVTGDVIVACKVIPARNKKTQYAYVDADYNKRHCRGYVALSETVKAFPAYNWKAFGFEIFEEQGEKDRYVFDYDQSSPYIQKIIDQIDTDKNKEISEPEIDRALKNKTVVSELSHYICWHRNEWSYDEIFDKLKPEIEALFDKKIKEEKAGDAKEKLERQKADSIARTKERIKQLCFWKDIKIDTAPDKDGFALKAFPASPYVYHFNPIAFVEQMGKTCHCGKEHIDLRDKMVFKSQGAGNFDCKKVCDEIVKAHTGYESEGAGQKFEGSSSAAYYQLALENSAHTSLVFYADEITEGMKYLDLALDKGYSIVVGINHTMKYDKKKEMQNHNEQTTDHFVVIVGRYCEGSTIYYRFWDVGTVNGKKNDYKFIRDIDNHLTCESDFKGRKTTVTQIRRLANGKLTITLTDLQENN